MNNYMQTNSSRCEIWNTREGTGRPKGSQSTALKPEVLKTQSLGKKTEQDTNVVKNKTKNHHIHREAETMSENRLKGCGQRDFMVSAKRQALAMADQEADHDL